MKISRTTLAVSAIAGIGYIATAILPFKIKSYEAWAIIASSRPLGCQANSWPSTKNQCMEWVEPTESRVVAMIAIIASIAFVLYISNKVKNSDTKAALKLTKINAIISIVAMAIGIMSYAYLHQHGQGLIFGFDPGENFEKMPVYLKNIGWGISEFKFVLITLFYGAGSLLALAYVKYFRGKLGPLKKDKLFQ